MQLSICLSFGKISQNPYNGRKCKLTRSICFYHLHLSLILEKKNLSRPNQVNGHYRFYILLTWSPTFGFIQERRLRGLNIVNKMNLVCELDRWGQGLLDCLCSDYFPKESIVRYCMFSITFAARWRGGEDIITDLNLFIIYGQLTENNSQNIIGRSPLPSQNFWVKRQKQPLTRVLTNIVSRNIWFGYILSVCDHNFGSHFS